jgi:hypothetical protein
MKLMFYERQHWSKLATESAPSHGEGATRARSALIFTLIDLLRRASASPGFQRWDLRDDVTRERDHQVGELSMRDSQSPRGAWAAKARELKASAVKAT